MAVIELKRILRESAVMATLMMLMTTIIAASGSRRPWAAMTLELLMLLYAAYAGWSLFDRERQENALEYLLSLPASRPQLLLQKITPRLLAALIALLLYLAAHLTMNFPTFFSRTDFSIVYFTVFLVSLSLSLSCKSFILAIFLCGFLCTGVYYGQTFFLSDFINRTGTAYYLNGAILLLAFPISFFFAFRRFDLRPLRYFHFRFIPPVLLILTAALIAGFIFRKHPFHDCYLTSQGEIFKSTCLHSTIIRTGETLPMPDTSGPIAESDHFMYLQSRIHENNICRTTRIEYLNRRTMERQTVYQCDENWSMINSPGEMAVLEGETCHALFFNRHERRFKIVSISRQTVREIPLQLNPPDDFPYKIIHLAQPPRQYFLIGSKYLYRAFEDGTAEQLAPALKTFMIWKNRLLEMSETQLALYELPDLAKPIFSQPGPVRKIIRRFAGYLSSVALYTTDGKIYAMNLETGAVSPMPFTRRPFFYERTGNILHLLWKNQDQVEYGTLTPNAAAVTIRETFNLDFPGLITRFHAAPWGVLAFDEKGNYKKVLFSPPPTP